MTRRPEVLLTFTALAGSDGARPLLRLDRLEDASDACAVDESLDAVQVPLSILQTVAARKPGRWDPVAERVPDALLPLLSTRSWGALGRVQVPRPLRSRIALEIVVAERFQMVRAALCVLVSHMDGMRVIAEASQGPELLEVLESVKPNVVIVDLALRDREGEPVILAIRERHPGLPILAVSVDDSLRSIREVVSVGAGGYVSRSATPEQFESALRNMATSGVHLPSRAVLDLLADENTKQPGDPLTPRQRQIVTLLAQGKAAKQIAFELDLSVRTVDVHRGRIFHLLQVDGLADLTRYALRRGLVEP